MAGNQAATATDLTGVVFLAGTMDPIVQPSASRSAWEASSTPRHYVTLARGGHLAFSDLCETKNAAGQNLLEVANAYSLCGAAAAGLLFDCDPAYLPGPTAWPVINHATTAVLQSTLQCATAGEAVDRVDDRFADVATYEAAP